jgi:predicted transcriptional regulator
MSVDGIRGLIEEMNLRVPKDYHKMKIEQLSKELRETMDFERQIFQRIEEYEKTGIEPDLVTYAKMICKNTAEREIAEIQEFYFKKIDTEYLNSN